jgi:hypothetical protein
MKRKLSNEKNKKNKSTENNKVAPTCRFWIDFDNLDECSECVDFEACKWHAEFELWPMEWEESWEKQTRTVK